MTVTLGINDNTLRQRLDEITKDADEIELKNQIEQVEMLALEHSHSITLIKENVPGSPTFTCYGFSFGLVGVHINSVILRYPGRDFVESLIGLLLQEVNPEQAEDGDHVLYFVQQLEHAGKVQGTMVESKWGKGHLWRHGVYEVPQKYGDTVRFFRQISHEEAVAAFRAFYPFGDLIQPVT